MATTELAATLIAVLSGFHGRWHDAIGAALMVVVCTVIVALWE